MNRKARARLAARKKASRPDRFIEDGYSHWKFSKDKSTSGSSDTTPVAHSDPTLVADFDPSQARDTHGRWSKEMEAARSKAHEYIREYGSATHSELAYHLADEGHATDHAHGLQLVGKLRDAGHLHESLNDVGQVALKIPSPAASGDSGSGGASKTPVEERIHAVHESLQPITQALDKLGSPEVRDRMMPGLQRISSRLTPAAAARIKENMDRAEIHESTIGCQTAIERELADNPKVAREVENSWPGGAYIGDGYRSLHVSSGYMGLQGGQGVFKGGTGHGPDKGNSESDAHVTAHELGHVIDGPKFEYSMSKEWRRAWIKEIGAGPDALPFGAKWLSKFSKVKDTPLTEYAKTHPSEGFAEFSRLLHASNVSHGTIEKTFPRCLAFWRSKGLWH
jgi:hypothetical protein